MASNGTAKGNAAKEPMSAVDAAWLGMDRPTNLMVINAVMQFDEPVAFDALRQVVADRLVARYARFRRRVVESSAGTGRCCWEDDPYFDLRYHVRRMALPAPGDTAALETLVGDLMGEALDPARPLWRFYLVENFGSGSAIIARIHHCVADGIALVRVLLSLTDGSPSVSPESGAIALPVENAPKAAPEADEQEPDGPLGPGGRPSIGAAARLAAYGAGLLAQKALDGIEHPDEALREVRSAGLLGATAAAILAKLVVMVPDRPSVFTGVRSASKLAVWSNSLELEEVKEVGRKMGATINDVLVATVAGALRRYMIERGDDVEAGDIRALVPVNLRPPDKRPTLGNEFSLVYLELPVGVASPRGRLAAVKQRMDRLKRSPEALLVYQVLRVLGTLPGAAAREAADWFSAKASCVLTNVPGPRSVLYFAGKPLRRIMFWVPQSGNIAVGISIISYAGEVTLGLMVDEALVGDPRRIIDAFHAEFASLRELADQEAIGEEQKST